MALEPQTGAMLGIARYVRSKDDPEIAEVADGVADDGSAGVSVVLLDQLTYRARREGIRRFTALVLSENRPALGLLEDVGETRRRRSAGELELLIERLLARDGRPARQCRAPRWEPHTGEDTGSARRRGNTAFPASPRAPDPDDRRRHQRRAQPAHRALALAVELAGATDGHYTWTARLQRSQGTPRCRGRPRHRE